MFDRNAISKSVALVIIAFENLLKSRLDVKIRVLEKMESLKSGISVNSFIAKR